MMLLILLSILVVLAACLYFILKEKYKYFENLGIPYEKPVFLLGNGWKVVLGIENISTFLTRVYKRNPDKKIVGIFHGIKPAVVLRDPELAGSVMIKEFSSFHDRGFSIDEEVNPIEGHLFNLSGYKWKVIRNNLSPTFTSGKLKGMLCHMDKCVDAFIADLDANLTKEIDMKKEFLKLTAHVIGSCTFGIETDAIRNENSDFTRLGVKIIQPDLKEFLVNIVRFFWPKLIIAMKLRSVSKEVNDFFFGLVKETMDYRQRTGYSRNDFLQLLLQLREKGEIQMTSDLENLDGSDNLQKKSYEKLAMTDSVLTAQAAVFLAAGLETTSTALCFICYELSKNHEIQEMARKEVRANKDKFGQFSYSALKEMHYLDAVIDEGLRLWPPVQGLIRECTKTTRLGDFTIEKGVMIHITAQDMQRDPAYFPDPLTFKPERFTEGSHTNHTFLPFGDGPRICIGERFARLEMKITMAKLLDKYRLDRSDKMAEPIKFKIIAFTNIPDSGIYCVFNKLDN